MAKPVSTYIYVSGSRIIGWEVEWGLQPPNPTPTPFHCHCLCKLVCVVCGLAGYAACLSSHNPAGWTVIMSTRGQVSSPIAWSSKPDSPFEGFLLCIHICMVARRPWECLCNVWHFLLVHHVYILGPPSQFWHGVTIWSTGSRRVLPVQV